VIRLDPARCCLLVVDVQERLATVMHAASMQRLVANTLILLEAANELGVRVLASEQYPKGLGPTVAPIAERLAAMGVTPYDKLDFDACGEPRIARALADADPRAVIVVGMEAHICVFQTARELVRRGYPTFVVDDAVASRTEDNRLAGLSLCERAGAVRTVTEAVAFDWVGRAGTPAFKVVSKAVK
jgi:nicotinamidase-related amidase